ncbi:MAG: Rhodanese domain protein [uncultured Sulfurovum sp.]|uniref:Rhodanese domain protein n=1 Tax=uncultured Sulfurovum sp. TaxID=269237 RepID=A0A6S6SVL6_9BACT|nr:MAG: Rhodanese domain protein [uncultured Sulfurovum sp.]
MAVMLAYFAYFKGWIFNDFENISPKIAHHLLKKSSDITIVDVRSKKEFEKDHLKGALSLPLDTLEEVNINAKKVLVYSERGERSVEASRILAKKGFEVLNLEGGVVFWIRAGYEVVK